MIVNATLINLYHVCMRECWLHANGVNMEHTSDIVYDGKILHETSYSQRAEKHSEIELSAAFLSDTNLSPIRLYGKIDFYDAQQKIIHETKRSDKVEKAHVWQTKFYLWLLRLNGIEEAAAILEYPLIKQIDKVDLSDEDVLYLKQVLRNIVELKQARYCPPVINSKICRSCSYFEFCYVDE